MNKNIYFALLITIIIYSVYSTLSYRHALPSRIDMINDNVNHPSQSSQTEFSNQLNLPVKQFATLPEYVQHTINYLKSNNFSRPEFGYVGGNVFSNYEKELPENIKGYYHEWDVHPKKSGVNRGTERIVTGDRGEVYYTNTHYGDTGIPAFYIIQF